MAVDGSRHVLATTGARADPHSLFRLLAVSKDDEDGPIGAASFVRMSHVGSGLCLVLDRAGPSGSRSTAPSAEPSAEPESSARRKGRRLADTALLPLSLRAESSEKDAFALQPVEPATLFHVHRLQRMMAVLRDFIATLGESARRADEIAERADASPPSSRRASFDRSSRPTMNPPEPAEAGRVLRVIEELCCMVVLVKHRPGIDIYAVDQVRTRRDLAEIIAERSRGRELSMDRAAGTRQAHAESPPLGARDRVHRQAHLDLLGADIRCRSGELEACARRRRCTQVCAGQQPPRLLHLGRITAISRRGRAGTRRSTPCAARRTNCSNSS